MNKLITTINEWKKYINSTKINESVDSREAIRKDIERMQGIMTRASGDSSKEIQLATQMANSIKDIDKAYRRAQAAKIMFGTNSEVTKTFQTRVDELENQNQTVSQDTIDNTGEVQSNTTNTMSKRDKDDKIEKKLTKVFGFDRTTYGQSPKKYFKTLFDPHQNIGLYGITSKDELNSYKQTLRNMGAKKFRTVKTRGGFFILCFYMDYDKYITQ